MALPLLNDEWLTPGQVAARLGVSIRTLADWRYRKTGPAYLRISRHVVRYAAAHLEAWLQTKVTIPSPDSRTRAFGVREGRLARAPGTPATQGIPPASHKSRLGRHKTKEDHRRAALSADRRETP
jgi:hypothetical protein